MVLRGGRTQHDAAAVAASAMDGRGLDQLPRFSGQVLVILLCGFRIFSYSFTTYYTITIFSAYIHDSTYIHYIQYTEIHYDIYIHYKLLAIYLFEAHVVCTAFDLLCNSDISVNKRYFF